MKIQRHIEIVRSSAKGLSSMSQRSCDAILATLQSKYTYVGVSIVNNPSDLKALAAKQPDMVFMGMKYVPDGQNSKVWISEFLDANNIIHTGSGKYAIEHEQSKPLAKMRVLEDGVPTARFMVAKQGQNIQESDMKLSFPLFAKPVCLGGGAGVDGESFIRTISELDSKIAQIHQHFAMDTLVEEYLPGREFSVAILRRPGTQELIAMPIEIAAPTSLSSDPILSQAVKLSNQEIILPVDDPVLHSHVTSTALRAFNALGGRDYGRIDIRLDEFGAAHFLEANLIPSLISGYGSFPKACLLNADIDYQQMIQTIVELAFDRLSSKLEKETEKRPLISPILAHASAA